jgi:hypothetical protein
VGDSGSVAADIRGTRRVGEDQVKRYTSTGNAEIEYEREDGPSIQECIA